MLRVFAIVLGSVAVTGCAIADAARITNAGLPVHEDSTQMVDLPLALNPRGMEPVNTEVRSCITGNGLGSACSRFRFKNSSVRLPLVSPSSDGRDEEDAQELVQRLRLETAFYAFYNDPSLPVGTATDRRNRVQQRLISAADINCSIFTDRLYKIQSTGNFGLGALATVMGGAGAIVTDVDAARLLSGLSSITSGVRAEANEDFFRKQWIEALGKAIETERNRLRGAINSRKAESISEYPVEEAVAEALRYNDACSVVSALKEVNRAVTIADDPAGLRAFRESYERAGFEARFTATVSSDGKLKTERLRPAPAGAVASVALAEIAMDIAEIRRQAEAGKASLAKDLGATAAKAPSDKIDEVVATLSTPDSSLQKYTGELSKQQDAYVDLRKHLADAQTSQTRQDAERALQANDAASEVFRQAARIAVQEASEKIGAIVQGASVAVAPPSSA